MFFTTDKAPTTESEGFRECRFMDIEVQGNSCIEKKRSRASELIANRPGTPYYIDDLPYLPDRRKLKKIKNLNKRLESEPCSFEENSEYSLGMPMSFLFLGISAIMPAIFYRN